MDTAGRRPSPFLQLDYLYTPSSDVAADARVFTEVLGGRLAFAVEGMGARVAMVELTDGPPHVLLTDHLEGDYLHLESAPTCSAEPGEPNPANDSASSTVTGSTVPGLPKNGVPPVAAIRPGAVAVILLVLVAVGARLRISRRRA